jgi:hypothetical protein
MIRACLLARKTAIFPALTDIPVDNDDPVFFSLYNCAHRACFQTERVGTMEAGSEKISYGNIRKFPIFNICDSHPAFRTPFQLMPIFASDYTGVASGASRLIDQKTPLHGHSS